MMKALVQDMYHWPVVSVNKLEQRAASSEKKWVERLDKVLSGEIPALVRGTGVGCDRVINHLHPPQLVKWTARRRM